MNIVPLIHTAKAEDVSLEKLAGNKSLSEAEKVTEVSRQFESVLLRQILGQARKPVFKSKFNEESMSSGIYHDMVTSQLADGISRSGSFGLARSLQAQLVHQTAKATDNPGKP